VLKNKQLYSSLRMTAALKINPNIHENHFFSKKNTRKIWPFK